MSSPSPHYKVGKPYKVNGQWYVPAVDDAYDRKGVASWYGAQFHGRPTANGEIFDMNRASAAHTTLPMPSIVEVTNLDNGRKMKVRVNDRGPFAEDRIIDLSKEAARRLGFLDQGLARVRVRYLGPAQLNGSGSPKPTASLTAPAANPQPDRTPPSEALTTLIAEIDQLQPSPIAPENVEAIPDPVTPQPDAAELYVVRIAALSSLENVNALETELSQIGPLRISRVEKPDLGTFYRISMGPFISRDNAIESLGSVRDAGYRDAAIIELSP